MKKLLLALITLASAPLLHAQVPTQYLAEEARLDPKRIRGITPLPVERLLVLPGDTMIAMGKDASIPKMFDMKASINSWNDNLNPNMKTQLWAIGGIGILGNRIWAEDRFNKQVVQLDRAGKIVESAPLPTWVHPHWADRHKFPLLGSMDVLAYYADGHMLVEPKEPRTLFDTPGYKRSLMHLLLIEKGGAVEREVARLDPRSHRVQLYEARKQNSFSAIAPWAMGDRWNITSDGSHLVVAQSGVLPTDSGKIRVTSINARGDTLFSKQYATTAVPVTKAAVDSALAKFNNFGPFTAVQVRDSVRTRVPPFRALMTSVFTSPNATWLFLRSPIDSVKDQTALILDAKGVVVAKVPVSGNLSPLAVDAAHLWASEKDTKALVRFTLHSTPPATPAPQPHSASAVAGKRPAS